MDGGNAGLPAGTGVTNGSTASGGKDTTSSNPQPVVTGGVGGGATAGAGGTNSNSSSVNGLAGSGRNGGAGGADPNPDAGGGGGGGYTGGGGGASTVGYNTQNGVDDVAGAGGGGGSSYIAPTVPLGAGTSAPSAISSVAGAKIASGAGNGAAGSVSLVWNSCIYDLAVDKSVSPTLTPTNAHGHLDRRRHQPRPLGDDPGRHRDHRRHPARRAEPRPSRRSRSRVAPTPSWGAVPSPARAAVGAAMPASLDCSRPYQIGAGAASGVRGLDVGETLTVTYTQLVTEAAGTTLTNTATVVDRQTGDTNDTDNAATTVVSTPGSRQRRAHRQRHRHRRQRARDDQRHGHTPGELRHALEPGRRGEPDLEPLRRRRPGHLDRRLRCRDLHAGGGIQGRPDTGHLSRHGHQRPDRDCHGDDHLRPDRHQRHSQQPRHRRAHIGCRSHQRRRDLGQLDPAPGRSRNRHAHCESGRRRRSGHLEHLRRERRLHPGVRLPDRSVPDHLPDHRHDRRHRRRDGHAELRAGGGQRLQPRQRPRHPRQRERAHQRHRKLHRGIAGLRLRARDHPQRSRRGHLVRAARRRHPVHPGARLQGRPDPGELPHHRHHG